MRDVVLWGLQKSLACHKIYGETNPETGTLCFPIRMNTTEPLSDSLEDYLEAIYHIVAQKQAARAKDIAGRMNVNNSSVTGALRSLADKGLINYAPYDVITLTHKGKKAADSVVRRHRVLCDFFTKVLAIGQEEAETAACKMEHGVSRIILERFIQFVEFVETCPQIDIQWTQKNGYECRPISSSYLEPEQE